MLNRLRRHYSAHVQKREATVALPHVAFMVVTSQRRDGIITSDREEKMSSSLVNGVRRHGSDLVLPNVRLLTHRAFDCDTTDSLSQAASKSMN